MDRYVSRLASFFVRWMPDAFVVALLLSFLTFVLSTTVAGYAPEAAVKSWGDSFWNLLTFTNQIALTLLLGYALANTPPVRAALLGLAGMASTPPRAYALACATSGLFALFSWGLSLVAAGIMARAIGESCRKNGVPVHYPLLVASAFSGFVVWHQGLSSTIGLTLATPGHFLESNIGLIPISQTLLNPWNLGIAVFVLATLPFLMAALRPRDTSEISEFPESQILGTAPPNDSSDSLEENTPARRLENSRVISLLIVAAGTAFLVLHFARWGGGLDLNTLNFGFLFLGILLAGSPIQYVRIIVEGGRVAAPFLLQYPFYAGIAGLMADSGLAGSFVEFFVEFSTAATLPLVGFLSGGLLNLFIPSGGGQWVVQGPIMVAAAQASGADVSRVAMAVALGDQWTNLIHPLSIIPVITIAGLSVRDIMGYTFVALIWSGGIFIAALILF